MSSTEIDTPRREASGTMQISNLAVQLLSRYTGRGPTKARTTITDSAVIVLLQATLTKAELTLVAAGREEIVLATRHEFQKIMRDELVAGVEAVTGRKVVAFMSDNHLDPDYAVEVLVLEPRAESDTA